MRIVLVDEHAIFREAVRRLLAHEDPTVEIVGEASTVREGLRIVECAQPDVVVLEILFPELNGLVAIRELRRLGTKSHILVLSALSMESFVIDAFAAGADGYTLKAQSVGASINALRTISSGGRYLPPHVAHVNTSPARGRHEGGRCIDRLSHRERDIFDLAVAGHPTQKIAELCLISAKTVEVHRTHINRKLHTHSTGDLIRLAILNGLIFGSLDVRVDPPA